MPNRPLMIAQHPDGKPLKLDVDTESVIGVNAGAPASARAERAGVPEVCALCDRPAAGGPALRRDRPRREDDAMLDELRLYHDRDGRERAYIEACRDDQRRRRTLNRVGRWIVMPLVLATTTGRFAALRGLHGSEEAKRRADESLVDLGRRRSRRKVRPAR